MMVRPQNDYHIPLVYLPGFLLGKNLRGAKDNRPLFLLFFLLGAKVVFWGGALPLVAESQFTAPIEISLVQE